FYVGSMEHKAKLGQSILKVLAYIYNDFRKNLADFGLYWKLSDVSPNWIQYIASCPPSADLVPHIQLVNADFFLHHTPTRHQGDIGNFLVWLKLDHLYPAAMVSRDLACGFLRLMQQIGRQDRPMRLWNTLVTWKGTGRAWGQHVRSSPQRDPELLQKLDQFLPPWDMFSWNHLEPVEFYDVIQWLKTSPNSPPNLIDRWQGYLAESIVQKSKNGIYAQDYSDAALENRWQDHLKREASFHGPPQEDLIQHWKSTLRKARGEDENGGSKDSSSSKDGSHSVSRIAPH
ncbi:hypothetical protein B0H13DRAFT_1935575, partial [Mycena leptocephala]